MLATNTMAYGTDAFAFKRQGLLKSKTCWDLTDETSCAGFEISGTEPPGTMRRIMFEIDNQLYKFNNGALIMYEGYGEIEDILENGNSVAELLELQSIPAFVGKKIYPVIALQADEDAQLMPKIKMSLRVNCFNDRYIKNEFSPIYDLRDGAKIHEIRSSIYTNGNGKAVIYCRINNPETGWGDWVFLTEAERNPATQIQFKVNYVLSALDGSDFAAVNYIQVFYTTDSDKLSGNTREIISLAQDYYSDLRTAYALIKHSELIDAEIKAYVNFSPLAVRRENLSLGVSTGETQTLYLQSGGVVDKNIVADTIHIDIDGKTLSNFYFDTENSTVTFQADAGKEISASYDCGLDNEDWREMELDFTNNEGEYYASRYVYRATDYENKKVAAVKFVITRKSGTVETTEIGTGEGTLQTFVLPYKAKLETLSASGAWTYDESGQILKTVANINTPITVGFDWLADFPQIFEYIAGWEV